jgi:ribose transport system substrate-binding protein
MAEWCEERAERVKIAVFTKNRTNPAYAAARLGAARVARRFGAETADFVPQTPDDPVDQSRLIDEALALRPDAVVLAPVHPTRINEALLRIQAAGVPLFGFVNPIPVGRCVSFVGSDDYRLGAEVAAHLYRHIRGTGEVLLVSGPADSVTSVPRMRAFHDAASGYPGVRLVGPCMGAYDRQRARQEVSRWLSQNPPPAGVLAANDAMALGVLEALREAGHEAAISGVNAIPEAIGAIKKGDMLASADFNAMGMAALATECALRHLRGETVPRRIELPVQIVDRANCSRWDLPFERRPIPTLEEVAT